MQPKKRKEKKVQQTPTWGGLSLRWQRKMDKNGLEVAILQPNKMTKYKLVLTLKKIKMAYKHWVKWQKKSENDLKIKWPSNTDLRWFKLGALKIDYCWLEVAENALKSEFFWSFFLSKILTKIKRTTNTNLRWFELEVAPKNGQKWSGGGHNTVKR